MPIFPSAAPSNTFLGQSHASSYSLILCHRPLRFEIDDDDVDDDNDYDDDDDDDDDYEKEGRWTMLQEEEEHWCQSFPLLLTCSCCEPLIL